MTTHNNKQQLTPLSTPPQQMQLEHNDDAILAGEEDISGDFSDDSDISSADAGSDYSDLDFNGKHRKQRKTKRFFRSIRDYIFKPLFMGASAAFGMSLGYALFDSFSRTKVFSKVFLVQSAKQ